jgi:GWxTD domain-containing protein
MDFRLRSHLPTILLLAIASLVLAGPAAAKKPTSPDDLFNPFLGVEYSYWLVGGIAQIASEEEIRTYLALQDDEAAKAFVESFWQKRNAGTEPFKKTPRQIFEQRAGEADRRFSERAYPGRRTDRGAIFVVHGEPEKIVFESPQTTSGYTLEVWYYPKKPELGLDQEKPKRLYKFVEIEGRTVFYRNQTKRPDLRDQLRQRN